MTVLRSFLLVVCTVYRVVCTAYRVVCIVYGPALSQTTSHMTVLRSLLLVVCSLQGTLRASLFGRRKDVVNQCLEFVYRVVCIQYIVLHLHWSLHMTVSCSLLLVVCIVYSVVCIVPSPALTLVIAHNCQPLTVIGCLPSLQDCLHSLQGCLHNYIVTYTDQKKEKKK